MPLYIKKPIVIIAIMLLLVRALIWGLGSYQGFGDLGYTIVSVFIVFIQTLVLSAILTLLIAFFPIKKLNYKQKILIIIPYVVIVISILGIFSTLQFMVFDYQVKSIFGI